MIEGGEMKNIKFLKAFIVPAFLYLPLGQIIDNVIPAYIDPGTGSIVLQVIIGALFSIIVATKLFWRQITVFLQNLLFRNRKNAEHKD